MQRICREIKIDVRKRLLIGFPAETVLNARVRYMVALSWDSGDLAVFLPRRFALTAWPKLWVKEIV